MAQSAEDVARESIERYSAGDFDRLRSLLADDFYEEELATQRRLEGADARVEAAQAWKQAFPGEHGTITAAYTNGNTVAIELTCRHYFDLMTLLQQIGAMDEAETTVASRLHSAARDR
jgi:SnoaL-like domain